MIIRTQCQNTYAYNIVIMKTLSHAKKIQHLESCNVKWCAKKVIV